MNVFLSPIKEKELFFKRPSLPNCFNERVNKSKSSNHKIHDMLCQKKVKLVGFGIIADVDVVLSESLTMGSLDLDISLVTPWQ